MVLRPTTFGPSKVTIIGDPCLMGGVVAATEPLRIAETVGETLTTLVTFTSTPVDRIGGPVTTEELVVVTPEELEVAANSSAVDVEISKRLGLLVVAKAGFANVLEGERANPAMSGTCALIDEVIAKPA